MKMHDYKYAGVDSNGVPVKGKMSAPSEMVCGKYFTEKGYRIKTFKESTNIISKLNNITIGRTVSRKELVLFLEELGALLDSGIKMVDALEILAFQQSKAQVRKIYMALYHEVYSGQGLSNAFSSYPSDFPPLLIALTKAGEKTGDMSKTLENAAEHFRTDLEIKSGVQKMIVKPLVYLFITIIVTILMIIFIIPVVEDLYASIDVPTEEMPVFTRVLLDISDFLTENGGIILLILLGSVSAYIFFYKTNAAFKFRIHRMMTKFPLFGNVIQMQNQVYIANTLAQLLDKRVKSQDALIITENALSNVAYKKLVNDTRTNIVNGEGFSKSFKESDLVDPLMVKMIETGEKSSSLPNMLNNLSGYYSKTMSTRMERLAGVIEPVLMILLLSLVTVLVLAIMLPSFDLGAQALESY